MFSDGKTPRVSIGMPVYNGEVSLEKVLDSLLEQTFSDFDLIISDNASTDRTEEICKTYAAKDDRIRYIRQVENIGPVANFKYVLLEAGGDYFIWAAADDIRSLDYLALNYDFLEKNPSYVASGCPNGFENWGADMDLVNFSVEEDEVFDRYTIFFKNCFRSHGLFYCLFRTKIMRDSKYLDKIFPNYDWLGVDWATILYLLSKGKINRTLEGNITLGVRGVSSSPNIFKLFNNSVIEYFIPFYVLSKIVMNFIEEFSVRQKIIILFILVRLNIFVIVEPLYQKQRSYLYRVYCRFLKPIVKQL